MTEELNQIAVARWEPLCVGGKVSECQTHMPGTVWVHAYVSARVLSFLNVYHQNYGHHHHIASESLSFACTLIPTTTVTVIPVALFKTEHY